MFAALPAELVARAAFFLPWRDEAALARTGRPVAAALRASQRDRPVLCFSCCDTPGSSFPSKRPPSWTGLPVAAVRHVLATSQALEVIDLAPVLDSGSACPPMHSVTAAYSWPHASAFEVAADNHSHTATVRATLTGDGLSRCASSQLRVLRLMLGFQGPSQLPSVVPSWRGTLRTLSLQVAGGPYDVSVVLAYAFQFASLEVLELQISDARRDSHSALPDVVRVSPELAAAIPRGLKRLEVYGIYVDRNLRAAMCERLSRLESLTLTQCRVPRLYQAFEGCAFGRTLKKLRIDGCYVFHQHARRTIRAIGHEFASCLEELTLEQAFWAIGPVAPLLKLAKLNLFYHAGDGLGYDADPPSSMDEGATDDRDDDERDDSAAFEVLEARGVRIIESSYCVGGRDVMDGHPDSDGDTDR